MVQDLPGQLANSASYEKHAMRGGMLEEGEVGCDLVGVFVFACGNEKAALEYGELLLADGGGQVSVY